LKREISVSIILKNNVVFVKKEKTVAIAAV